MPISDFKGSRVARTRSRVASTARLGTQEQQDDARREHAAAKLAAFIEKTVAEAPRLTDEEFNEFALLIRGGASA